MSERITQSDVARIAATVTEGLPEGFAILKQQRNGYTGIDLYKGAGNSADPLRMMDTLFIGTARECYTYLQGFRRSQLMRHA